MDITVFTYAIDDNIAFLRVLGKRLSNYGINEYRLFTDHEQLIQALNSNVHICIIDHTLNGVTGLYVLRTIKEIVPDCYFIIMSDNDNIHVLIEYVNEGIYKYVNKFNTEDSFLHVANWVKELVPKVKERILKAANAEEIRRLLKKYE